MRFEPQREITYLLISAPKEDSNQPARMRRSVFTVRMNKLCILGYPNWAQWRFGSYCAGWSESSPGTANGTFSVVVAHIIWTYHLVCSTFHCEVYLITLSIGKQAFANSVDPDQKPLTRRLIRIYTVCHPSSTILDILADSRINYFKF